MKKVILSVTFVAFALALQAGETKDAATKTVSSTTKVSTTATATAKTECTATAKTKDAGACDACCKAEPKKQALMSPKAAAEKGS